MFAIYLEFKDTFKYDPVANEWERDEYAVGKLNAWIGKNSETHCVSVIDYTVVPSKFHNGFTQTCILAKAYPLQKDTEECEE